jgi:hypothetical protein
MSNPSTCRNAPKTATTLSFTATIVLLAVMPSSEAFARIRGPIGDTLSIECLNLQNKGDALISEYKNATPTRREDIILELRANGRKWIEIGCRAVFGNISKMGASPDRKEYQVPQSLTEGSNSGSPANSGPASAPKTETIFLY